MKVLKWIFIIILILIALFLAFSASQENQLKVEESIVIDAPSSQVYETILNFETWSEWATWNQKDPNMEVEYSGEMGSIGAKSSWKSDHPEVGNGSQEVVELTENEHIKTAMRFEGWDAVSYAEFTLNETEEGTEITWNYTGAETAFYMNWMNTIMAPMIKLNYQESLAGLKSYIEGMEPSAEVANPMNLEMVQTEGISVVSILDSTDAEGISDKLAELYTELSIYLETDEDANPAGMPLALYHAYAPDRVILEAAIPYTGEAEANGRIEVKETHEGNAIKGIHYGDYNASGDMHMAIEAFAKESDLSYVGACWEIYANDPETVDSAAVETHIYYPVK